MSERDKKIYEKINHAVRLLCDVYEILNTQEEIKNQESNNFLPISKFCLKYPQYTEGSIRSYILENKKNFNEKVTCRVGKRIFIKEQEFFSWMDGKI